MFGISVFQSVLERLREETEATTDDAEDSTGVEMRGFVQGFIVAGSSSTAADGGAVARAYLDMAGEADLLPAPPPPKPVMPEHLTRISPQEIAADIALGEHETPVTLADKRRSFASENHPDRHYPDFRVNATIRMKIANMLIDEALRRLVPHSAH